MALIQNNKKTISPSDTWKFLIPSLIGALLFLCPISYNGEVTIGVAFWHLFSNPLSVK